MANFLLWNVQRKPLDTLVLRLAEDHQIDGLFLVEYSEHSRLPEELKRLELVQIPSQDRFGVFVKRTFTMDRLTPITATERVDYWWCIFPTKTDILLVLVHGQDRRHFDDSTRGMLFQQTTEAVRYFEEQLGHRRTIVLGDFNSNPFEPSIASANGLHALGVRTIRGQFERTVVTDPHGFFYNPMWRHFGRGMDSASATYYYHGYHAHELMWHMLDQVVLRPEAIDRFREDKLRILTMAGEVNLATEVGHPNRALA
jgi:hypothetical protein